MLFRNHLFGTLTLAFAIVSLIYENVYASQAIRNRDWEETRDIKNQNQQAAITGGTILGGSASLVGGQIVLSRHQERIKILKEEKARLKEMIEKDFQKAQKEGKEDFKVLCEFHEKLCSALEDEAYWKEISAYGKTALETVGAGTAALVSFVLGRKVTQKVYGL